MEPEIARGGLQKIGGWGFRGAKLLYAGGYLFLQKLIFKINNLLRKTLCRGLGVRCEF